VNGIDPQGRATVPTPYEFEGVIGSDQRTNAQQGQVDPSGCIGTLEPNIEKKRDDEGQMKERKDKVDVKGGRHSMNEPYFSSPFNDTSPR
jgi:hypothetical protein